VFAPLAVTLTEPPAQYEGEDGESVTVGEGFTVTVTVVVLVHPAPLVPVIVYVVVTVGEAETVAPVVALNPVAGAQAYVLAPLAVMLTELPLQIVGAAGFLVTVGKGFTVTVTVVVFVQPAALVPVMV
jgi:hypothetical protein